jgi:small-conductance mechanosensitive channel
MTVAPLTDVSSWARGNGLEIVLVILGAIILTRALRWVGMRVTRSIDDRASEGDPLLRSEASKHRHALSEVLTWGVIVVAYAAAAVLVFQRLDIPLTGFVAPATVVGVALGLGAQQLVQDVLSGFFLIAERQYGFGDVVRLSVPGAGLPITGTVEDLTLRVTTMRTADGEVVITPNGKIAQVVNLSRDWARAVVDVPVGPGTRLDAINVILREVCSEAYADGALRPLLLAPPTVMGIERLELGQLSVRVVARTLPGKQFEVGRALRSRISLAVAKAWT